MSASVLTLSSSSSMYEASEKTVRQSSAKQGQLSAKRVQLSQIEPEKIVEFLRHRHPSKTADIVAAETGVSATTVRKWLERGSLPSLGAFLALLSVYGPALLAAGMGHGAPAWVNDEARKQARAALEADVARLQDELQRI